MSTGETELALGFAHQEEEKALGVLTKILPHLAPENIVIVGGLAMRHHWINHELPYQQRPFNDLDLMIKDKSEMHPSITDEFLVYHYHPPRNTSFFAGLVDPETKVQIDIFDYFHPPVEPVTVQVAGFQLQLRGIEDQLTKTVYDLMKIIKGQKLSPKQFTAAKLLMLIADMEKAEQIWSNKYAIKYPFSLQEAMKKVEEEAEIHPENVLENPGRRAVYVCSECEETPGFPLAPMEEIYTLLGFVE